MEAAADSKTEPQLVLAIQRASFDETMPMGEDLSTRFVIMEIETDDGKPQ